MLMFYPDKMQKERISLQAEKVMGICGEFCGLWVVSAHMHAQTWKCMLVILGGFTGGRHRGRRCLRNINFWRSRIQFWSPLCAWHLMASERLEWGLSKHFLGSLNSTRLKLELWSRT